MSAVLCHQAQVAARSKTLCEQLSSNARVLDKCLNTQG